MNWTNKYNNFRVKCIEVLKEELKKGYNQEELWNSGDNLRYGLPRATYSEDGSYEFYSLVSWDGDSFIGMSWESGEYYSFWIDDLETRTICHLIDLINEPIKESTLD